MGEAIAVVGLGYVGCVTAACLAELGHRVTGVDRDEHKISAVLDGRAPFFEPGLEPLVQKNVAEGRLSASTDLATALAEADIALICVGTPSERNGNLALEQLRRVSTAIGQCLAGRIRPLIVAVRSTVFPGTCEDVVAQHIGHAAKVSIVSHPEFLREGAAVKDFLEPSLLVVGGSDRRAMERVANLYEPLGAAPCLVSLRTAEMIKYACNSFHALKIAFANEVGTLALELGIDGHEVMNTLCRDSRLNLSAAYLKPGFAFGGSCLPKDLRALVYRAGRLDVKLPLMESILPSNREHLQRAVDAILDLPVERVGFFGLAFKENTDDLRESPVVSLLEQLIGKGRDVRVFDPQIRLDQIYGSNQQFILAAIPHISKLLDYSIGEILGWSEYLVVAQKPAPAMAERIRKSGIPVLDLVGAFPEVWARRPARALDAGA
jgi:GDP-mannose 6-dehydrogenase